MRGSFEEQRYLPVAKEITTEWGRAPPGKHCPITLTTTGGDGAANSEKLLSGQ